MSKLYGKRCEACGLPSAGKGILCSPCKKMAGRRNQTPEEFKSDADVGWWTNVLCKAVDEAEKARRDGALDVLLYGAGDYWKPPYKYFGRRKRISGTIALKKKGAE